MYLKVYIRGHNSIECKKLAKHVFIKCYAYKIRVRWLKEFEQRMAAEEEIAMEINLPCQILLNVNIVYVYSTMICHLCHPRSSYPIRNITNMLAHKDQISNSFLPELHKLDTFLFP